METSDIKEKDRLWSAIQESQKNLQILKTKERVEEPKALIGRYFKDYQDVSRGHFYSYIRFDSVDDYGELRRLEK